MKTSAAQQWWYALPGLPLAALTLPVYVFVPTFYGELGVSLALIGTVLLAVRILDAVTDPMIGFVSDRMSVPLLGRMGRRKPWLLIGLPPTLLAVWMVFVPADNPDATYLLLWSAVLSIGWTLMLLPYNAWGAEIVEDYDGRTGITARREGLIVLGTLVATSAPVLLGVWDGDTSAGLGDALHALAIGLVVLIPLTVALALWRVPRERDRSRSRIRFRDGLKTLRTNKAFVRLISAFLINGWANGLPASLFVLFVTHVLVSPDMVGPLLFLYFLAGVAAIPGWVMIAKRFGKHRTWVGSMTLACATFVWVPFLGPGDVWAFGVIVVLSGLAVGADLVLPASIQADVVDVDTAETGEQRTGLYFAMWSLATKLSLALAAGVAFPLLDLAGFRADVLPSGGDANEGTSLLALSLLYAGLPVILKLPALVLMWNFPLSRDAQAALRDKINAAA